VLPIFLFIKKNHTLIGGLAPLKWKS